MKKDHIYMVVKESLTHECSFGDIVIGTGEEFCPQIPFPEMHLYDISNDRKQILETDEVIEIGEL
jgi:hypothetical protein